MKFKFISVLLGMTLLGCASGNLNSTEASSQRPLPASDPQSKVILTALPEPKIPAGECGLVLWTLDADRPMPVFRFVVNKNGEVMLNGEEHSFALESHSGAAGFGVYEKLSFSSGAGLALNISVKFGSGFDGGSYVQRGLIVIDDNEGWRSVTPVAGIAGCRG